ncbi:hypothetical protein [Brevifollis gellanilyticus]|uniref:Uncharacterized protein n=1 Tax=Brevifollis gellanilyticus TaxID=748831 RepID=A0A512ME08_9BACT|nr:hypothetical protein [Brevifollis gellanilyticus]GEP44938.1 hypothetical protein BGE01nite_42290 [Brevifollis gellanilyticus]
MPKATPLWKRILRVLGLTTLICGTVVGAVCWLYWDEVERLIQPHWQEFAHGKVLEAASRYGANLPEVDEVRLKLLHEVPTSSSDKSYEPPGSDETYYVIKEKTVTGEEARAIAVLWRHLIWDQGGGAACFQPHHMVEFRNRGKTILESAVCFHCSRVTLPILLRSSTIGVVFGEGIKLPGKPTPYPLEMALDVHLGPYIPPPRKQR